MAFTDLEYKVIKIEVGKFIDHIRPPQNSRIEVDVIYNIKEDSVKFCELRRVWGVGCGVANLAQCVNFHSQKSPILSFRQVDSLRDG